MTANEDKYCPETRQRDGSRVVWKCTRLRHADGHHYFTSASSDNTRLSAEALLETHFRESILRSGGQSFKMVPAKAGPPDRLVLFPGGRIYLVELKTETGVVSPIQHHWHDRALRDQHVKTWVLYGRAAVDEWVDRAATDPDSLD